MINMFNMESFWLYFNEFTEPDNLKPYLVNGGDINFIHPNSGWSLLNLAIENKNKEFIKALAEEGIDLNEPQANRPLFHALDIDIDSAIQQNKEIDFAITCLLIELGANVQKTDVNNHSIKDVISAYGDDVVKKFDQEIAKRGIMVNVLGS